MQVGTCAGQTMKPFIMAAGLATALAMTGPAMAQSPSNLDAPMTMGCGQAIVTLIRYQINYHNHTGQRAVVDLALNDCLRGNRDAAMEKIRPVMMRAQLRMPPMPAQQP
jgi:hypothetical protein